RCRIGSLPFLHRLAPYLSVNRRQQRAAFGAAPCERREVVGGVRLVPGHGSIIRTKSPRRRSHSASASRVASRASSRSTANRASRAASLILGGAAGAAAASGHERRPAGIGTGAGAQPATVSTRSAARIILES